ncbi:MAG: acetoin utilization protein acuB [Flavobacteriaceae bacterium]|nr:acetoin utilization protein acuB [Muriicola sp.]MBT8291294.1 acetoin utilization protein acuB [Muriicola sp.]NNC61154.1 acetoin utilization protein acuB [Eudoraea sp.]NNK36493.1 acetoin utilization protein acuB [Eudoraea sp.]NNL38402.1 acetoin utilization protein acuB [Flavobacteriaceae bacterium]
MSIESHIIHSIPVFDVQDMLAEPIHFFKNSTYSHVAITEDQKLLGLLSENDLEAFEEDQKISSFKTNLESFFAVRETSWLDVLELFSRNEANLLPVLDEEAHVLGYYDLNDFVGVFIDTPFFKEPGAILVVAKGIKDYSFSEIAQIVESNNTKLIGAFITDSRSEVVQITIKIGMNNFNEVVNTFRRYNYSILFGNKADQFLEDLKERSDYLDKFLNV